DRQSRTGRCTVAAVVRVLLVRAQVVEDVVLDEPVERFGSIFRLGLYIVLSIVQKEGVLNDDVLSTLEVDGSVVLTLPGLATLSVGLMRLEEVLDGHPVDERIRGGHRERIALAPVDVAGPGGRSPGVA